MLPGCNRKYIFGLLPLGMNIKSPAIVRLFQELDETMIGVLPFSAHVFRTTGFSEMPDSSS